MPAGSTVSPTEGRPKAASRWPPCAPRGAGVGRRARARPRGEAPLLVVLDGIQDPQNTGAIIRVAEAAGAHGVILPARRASGLTPAVGRAPAGPGQARPGGP